MKLCFPEKILDQHLVVLGKTGSGKSSALRHIVEHLLQHKKRVCIVDPKGDWHGLKASADGKGAGYPVIAIGDFNNPKATDVPINDRAGKHVAELIASGNRPCIIGFRGWTIGSMVRFWIDFASTLFAANSGELYLVGDEFHHFAAKGKIMDVEAGKCLHWSNRLLSEGRGIGLVCLIASQRPQKVHNDTLTCCETLVAMRVVHKADRDAVQDWIDGCGDDKQGEIVMRALASMPRGEAYVWSPEIGFGPERLKFPMFETYDSFAPPQLQKKVSMSGWAVVDLEEVKVSLASVIQEAEANDPVLLKRHIADLKRQLGAAAKAKETVVQEVVKEVVKEVPVIKPEVVDKLMGLRAVIADFGRLLEDAVGRFPSVSALRAAQKQLNAISGKVNRTPGQATLPKNLPRPPVKASIPARAGSLEANLAKKDMKLLMVLSAFPEGVQAGKLMLLAGYKWNGDSRNSLARLRTAGAVVGGNQEVMRITDYGESLGPFEPLPTGQELIAYWLGHSSFAQKDRALLRLFVDHEEGLTADQLCTLSGYEWNGDTRNSLARLRTAGVVEGRNGETMRLAQHLREQLG